VKTLYLIGILICALFNSFVQSYDYEAWQYGIPVRALIIARGDREKALVELTLAELGEVVVISRYEQKSTRL
jgi:hypothetical protein